VALVTVQIRAGVNFINVKHTPFSHERHFGSFFYAHISRKKATKMTFVQKTRAFNIDEIDGRRAARLHWFYTAQAIF